MDPLFSRRILWFLCLLSIAFAPGIDGADCNGNGVDDEEDIQNGTSEDCNGNLRPDECDRAPFSLVPDKVRGIAFPKTLRALDATDADGDGDLDLFVAYRPGGRDAPSSILLIRNAADSLGSRGGPYSAGVNLREMDTGDFNGDGKPDVVTVNDIQVHVLLNKGDGSLENPINLTPTSQTRVVEAVDLTDDGADEIVVSSHDGTTISVFSNDGEGTFSDPADVEAVEDVFGLTGGDVDGDGDLDVVGVSKQSETGYVVFLNDGGSLSLAKTYPSTTSRFTKFTSRDLNGDDRPDLVAVSSRQLAVRLNNGDGSFLDETLYEASVLKGIAASDFDGDGHVDLVTLRRSQGLPAVLHIRFNDGLGGFHATAELTLEKLPNFVTAGDFDGDGIADLSVGFADSAVILTNRDRQESSVQRVDFGPLQGCTDARGCRTHGLAVEDFDNDGDIDVLGSNTHPGSFSILINNGVGGLEAQRARTFGGEHPQAIATGDLDGDGDADAVTCDNLSNDIRVHISAGNGTYARPTIFRVGTAPINVRIADFDGDGQLDIATANEGSSDVSVLTNRGQGRFRAINVRRERVRRSPKALIPSDLDGDGDVDIAVANSGDVFVSLLINDGKATFRPISIRIDGSPHHIDSADLDADGDMDLLTANMNRNSVSVLLNKGDATFEKPIDIPIGRGPYSAVAADFDNDGILDILACSESASSVSVLNGTGDGTFTLQEHLAVGLGPRFIGLADFEPDGDIDFVTNNRQGQSFTAIYNQRSNASNDYLTSLCTPLDFSVVAAESASGVARSFVKYTIPLGDEPGFPGTVYQNVNKFPLHEEFLAEKFAKQFPLLDPDIYDVLVGRRATRRFFVGAISRIPQEGRFVYGFSVFARFNDDVEKLTSEEVKGIYEKLQESFHLEPLVYFPSSADAKTVAQSWDNPGFPILDAPPPLGQLYRAYTIGVGYGRVRIPSRAEFDKLNDSGLLNPQDIYVLDHAPRDTEGVPAAIFTADEQGALSHLAVRTSRRGTPNAFVADAPSVFEEWEGQLVRVEVDQFQFSIEAASEAEADDFWARSRPTLSELPQVDPDFGDIMDLMEVADLERADDTFPIEARFGGKVSNFARLQTILEGDFAAYQAVGIGIPVHYYLEFMRSNRIRSAVVQGSTVTYQEYVDELLESDMFQSDSKFRFDALDDLRDAIRDDSKVDNDLVRSIATKIRQVFGATNERVRTRSSSNIEDAPEFNGAGLYDSTSACPDDDLDGDNRGPSRCEPPDADERGIARGLRRVWRSLWNFRAYEERAYFSIPEDIAAMGVLVSKAFRDEKVNGVALTGNPRNPRDRRYIIASQPGEASVVSPEPGQVVAKDLLEVVDGEVVQILRAIPSSLTPNGTHVLSDEQLRELGRLLWHIDTNFPIDTGRHERENFLMDVEFKIDSDDSLVIKQVRPFLLTSAEPKDPDFEIEIPDGAVACSQYVLFGKPREEYQRKAILHFNGGSYTLPASVESFSAELIEKVEFLPEVGVAMPKGPGLFTVTTRPTDAQVSYTFRYEQILELPDGTEMTITADIPKDDLEFGLTFASRNGVPIEERHTVDSEFLTSVFGIRGLGGLDLKEPFFNFSSCSYESLPLVEIQASLDDGTIIVLDQRRLGKDEAAATDAPPASIVAAEVSLAGERQRTQDYWRLVYAGTQKHNTHEEFWVVLDPPVTVPGLETPVHIVELIAPISSQGQAATAKANYLGPNFEVLASPNVSSYAFVDSDTPRTTFRRGDFDANGTLQISDAIALVGYLYGDGSPSPCMKAADANDNGALTVTDAVTVLRFLFMPGEPHPGSLARCVSDATPDALECDSYRACDGEG